MAKCTEADLHSLPKYIDNRKIKLCYSYVLGKCQGKNVGDHQGGMHLGGILMTTLLTHLLVHYGQGMNMVWHTTLLHKYPHTNDTQANGTSGYHIEGCLWCRTMQASLSGIAEGRSWQMARLPMSQNILWTQKPMQSIWQNGHFRQCIR